MRGTVTSFDDHRGYGVIVADGRELFFHCTQLVDGSRTIAVGAPVCFSLVPGLRGRWEAADISKV